MRTAILVVLALLVSGCGQLFTPTTSVEGARVESQKLREKVTGAKDVYRRHTLETVTPVPRPVLARPVHNSIPLPTDATEAKAAAPVAPPAGVNPPAPRKETHSAEVWEEWTDPEPGKRTETLEEWESTEPSTDTEYAAGKSRGPDVKGPGASGSTGEAPEVNLDTGTSSGGTMKWSTKLVAQALKGPLILLGIGAALLIGGFILIFLAKLTAWGIGAIACGLCMIGIGLAVEAYPWVALAAPLILLAAIAGGIVYLWKTGRLATAWTQVVTGTDEFLAKIKTNPALTPEAKAAVVADFTAAQDTNQDKSTTQALVDQTQAANK